jgi:hypothetical protein
MSIETLEEKAPETYADKKLGFWRFGFDEEAVNRLNKVKADLDAVMSPAEHEAWKAEHQRLEDEATALGLKRFSPDDRLPSISWVIDEAEKRQSCTPEEASYLRENFIHSENGLPIVLT